MARKSGQSKIITLQNKEEKRTSGWGWGECQQNLWLDEGSPVEEGIEKGGLLREFLCREEKSSMKSTEGGSTLSASIWNLPQVETTLATRAAGFFLVLLHGHDRQHSENRSFLGAVDIWVSRLTTTNKTLKIAIKEECAQTNIKTYHKVCLPRAVWLILVHTNKQINGTEDSRKIELNVWME